MKKRRFYEGGFNDYEGAIGSGADTPDKAIARKAAADVLAGRAGDKAAGLASTKGQDVGFFKRLSMGNIDAPGSEASNSFGAGKGSSDRMAQAADQDSPVRPVQSISAPAPGSLPSFDDFKRDNTPIDMAESPMLRGTPTGPGTYKRDTEGEAASTLARESVRKTPTNRVVGAAELKKSGMSLRDFLNKERGLKRRPDTTDYEAALKSVAKGKATRESDMQIDSRKKGGSIKAYAKGGSVSSRADGCAQRGKTRGMMR